jgi:hypothetical protein
MFSFAMAILVDLKLEFLFAKNLYLKSFGFIQTQILEYQQSLEFLVLFKITRSADFWLMSADLIWFKLGDFKEDKKSRINLFR